MLCARRWLALLVAIAGAAPPISGQTAAPATEARAGAGARTIVGPVRGPRGRDSAARNVEAFVRAREVQLRFCYVEHGAGRDSALTGVLAVAVRLGRSRAADSVALRPVAGGPWERAAGDSVRRCLRARIARWRWPSGTASGTYVFDLALFRDPAFPRPSDWPPPRRATRIP